jgi:heptosyltransferase III
MPPSSATRPIVVRFAALGDTVLLTVLIDRLAKRYGQAVDVLSSGEWTRTLLAHDPAVAELRTVSSRKTPYWLASTQRDAVKWLRQKSGPVYLCDPDDAARRLVERAVPKERIVSLWDRWPGVETHWADWWASVGADQPVVAGVGQPRLTMPHDWLDDAKRWLIERNLDKYPLLLVQPGNKKTAKALSLSRKSDKYWPPERWAETIRRALELRSDLRVVICGSLRESALGHKIARLVRDPRVVAAAGDLPLSRLVALTSLAHSMIAVDTGPAHVAAAMDCPCVVLFGRYGWQRWQPRAPRSTVIALGGREYCASATVQSIGVDEVFDAWRRLPARGVSLAGVVKSNDRVATARAVRIAA